MVNFGWTGRDVDHVSHLKCTRAGGEYLEEARRKSHLHNKTQLGLCAELIMSITET